VIRNGPYWANREVVEAGIAYARPWWRDADLPDPLDRRDVESRPDLIAAAISRRQADDRLIGLPHLMCWPKPSGSLRVMTALDPIADLGYRQLVGRIAPAISAATPPHVHHTRLVVGTNRWATENWRRARTRYDECVERERNSEGWSGVGALDVRDHYGSVDLEVLRTILHSAACAEGAVADTLHFLSSFAASTRRHGLPVGPEASAALGTIALLPIDRRLTRGDTRVLRWMDDILLFVTAEARYLELKGLASDQLSLNGQRLNLEKCNYEAFAGGVKDIVHEFLSGFADESGRKWFEDPASELAARAEWHNPIGISRALGQLRSIGDPTGIKTLMSYPWVLRQFPRQTGRYLWSVHADIDEWSFFTDQVLAETFDGNVASQMWLARLLRVKRVSPTIGLSLFEKGLSLDRVRFAPAANEMLVAAGRSQEKANIRQRRAVDHALEFADLDARRCLLDVCCRETPTRQIRAGIEHLRRADPDLAATLSLVDAA
jgi:hypothetical protein